MGFYSNRSRVTPFPPKGLRDGLHKFTSICISLAQGRGWNLFGQLSLDSLLFSQPPSDGHVG